MNNALSVRGVIGDRIGTVPTTCQLSNPAPESVEHMLFGCDFARAAWWASFLNLGSDQLHGTFRERFGSCFASLDDANFVSFVCMTWAIWRVKSAVVMGEKQCSLAVCFKYYKEVLLVCQSSYSSTNLAWTTAVIGNAPLQQSEITDNLVCCVDGSCVS